MIERQIEKIITPRVEDENLEKKIEKVTQELEKLNQRLVVALKPRNEGENDILDNLKMNSYMDSRSLAEALGWPDNLQNELVFILRMAQGGGLRTNHQKFRKQIKKLRKLLGRAKLQFSIHTTKAGPTQKNISTYEFTYCRD